jgi:hypothetical protein
MRIRFSLGAAALALTGPLVGQGSNALYPSASVLSGFDYQRYGFDKSYATQSASQWSIPVVLVAPLGRQASLDLTTHYAHTEVTSAGSLSYSGFTDTQLRLLYVIGQQRAVASFSLNLPTGKNSFPTAQFPVSTAISSNYLSFPVNNLGSGFGVTTGLAYAAPAGAWNIGLAGSVRYQASYRPFTADTFNYNPGLEGRLRFGVDRLIGERARFMLGETFSTFSTDQFSGTGSFVSGWYNPGARFITDLGYAYSWGRTTLTFGAWDYYRLAGSAVAGTASDTKENVFNCELRIARQLSPRLTIEPLVGFRQWNPAGGTAGRLYTVGTNARIGLSDQMSGVASARFGSGWGVTATGLSLYLRYQP